MKSFDSKKKVIMNVTESFRNAKGFKFKNNLRNFRNYVHIEKEVNGEEIDIKWYEIIKPASEKNFESFR